MSLNVIDRLHVHYVHYVYIYELGWGVVQQFMPVYKYTVYK